MKKIVLIILLLIPTLLHATEPTVIINEIAWMGSTASSNDEWLELYNATDEEIDLTGWMLVAADGSPNILLEGIISPGAYFLLERTDDESVPEIPADQIYAGALGNTGEWLKLSNQNGTLIDQINASEGWPAGDNQAKLTMELVNNNWQNSTEPNGSPKSANASAENIESPDTKTDDQSNQVEQERSLNEQKVMKQAVVINEIFPDPAGPDLENEFIELKNISAAPIDLTGWQLTTSRQTYILPSLKIWPEVIVFFKRTETKLALNNNKEKISLYAKNRQLIDQVEYKTKAAENLSYQRTADLSLVWDQISPGEENIGKIKKPPMIVLDPIKQANLNEFIQFDASDSFDPENLDLTFFWDFGDGRTGQGFTPRQIYTKPGNYDVVLTIINTDQASSTKNFKIKIIDPLPKFNSTSTKPTSSSQIIQNTEENEEFIPFIFISEFLPNPVGSDNQEFIELFSNHPTPVSLAGWQLDDNAAGSKPYTISDHTIIKPGQYLAFFKTETGLALNNDHDEIRLFSPKGTMVDYVQYDGIKEGVSMVLDEQFSWQQTLTPTPNEINTLNLPSKTTTSPSTTPKILGSNNEITTQQSSPPTNRYTFSMIMAAGVIMVGAISIFLKK